MKSTKVEKDRKRLNKVKMVKMVDEGQMESNVVKKGRIRLNKVE